MASSSSSSLIILKSSDGGSFEKQEAVVKQIPEIKRLLEEDNTKLCCFSISDVVEKLSQCLTGDCDKKCIHLVSINENVLAKIIEYCELCYAGDKEKLESFERELLDLSDVTLIHLSTAAKGLGMMSLMMLATEAMAKQIARSNARRLNA